MALGLTSRCAQEGPSKVPEATNGEEQNEPPETAGLHS
jgi:hypothetical protein